MDVSILRELDVAVPDPDGGGGLRFTPIAAASGAVRIGDRVFVVADDAHDLAGFDLGVPGPGRIFSAGRPALPTDPAERKRHKPDLEALVHLPDGSLVAMASGSSPDRNEGLRWSLGPDGWPAGTPAAVDLAALHKDLAGRLPELNLEGAAVVGDRLLLLQRGSGEHAKNAVVSFALAAATAEVAAGALGTRALLEVREYDLGDADGVPLCFSDGAGLPDGRLVFTAVAEGGGSTVADGAFAGAAVGTLSPSGDLESLEAIEPASKVEGITATPVAGGRYELLLVADADDPGKPSPLLRARL
jgi:hypothetical protein